MTGEGVSLVLSLVACFILLCRVDKMERGVTRPGVFYQHAALAVALFASAVMQFTAFVHFAPAVMAAGVVVFLLYSAGRWREGAPDDTTKPMELESGDLKHVSGGRR